MKKLFASVTALFLMLSVSACDDIDGIKREIKEHIADTGVRNTSQIDPPVSKNTNSDTGYIDIEAAKNVALTHAGADSSSANMLECDFDIDDGIASYEIEFIFESDKYEYDIDAVSAEILKAEKNDRNILASSEPSGEKTEDEVKEIIANHAGINISEIKFIRVEKDRDNGKAVYEVEFYHDGYEYEYEVAAADGSIIGFEKDRD